MEDRIAPGAGPTPALAASTLTSQAQSQSLPDSPPLVPLTGPALRSALPRGPPFASPTLAPAALPGDSEPGTTYSSKRPRSDSRCNSDSTLTNLSDLSDPDPDSDALEPAAVAEPGRWSSGSPDTTPTRLRKSSRLNNCKPGSLNKFKKSEKRRMSASAAPEGSSRRRTTHDEAQDADDEDEGDTNVRPDTKGKGKSKATPPRQQKHSTKPDPPARAPPPASGDEGVPIFLRTRLQFSMSSTSPAAVRTSASPTPAHRPPSSRKRAPNTSRPLPRSAVPLPTAPSELDAPEPGQRNPDAMETNAAAIFSPELGLELSLLSITNRSEPSTPPPSAFPSDEPRDAPAAPAPAPADKTDAAQSSDDDSDVIAKRLLRPSPLKRTRPVMNAGQASTSEDEPLAKRMLMGFSPELGISEPELQEPAVAPARLEPVQEAAESSADSEEALASAFPRAAPLELPLASASKPATLQRKRPRDDADDEPATSPTALATPAPTTSHEVEILNSQFDSWRQESVQPKNVTRRTARIARAPATVFASAPAPPQCTPSPAPALPPTLKRPGPSLGPHKKKKKTTKTKRTALRASWADSEESSSAPAPSRTPSKWRAASSQPAAAGETADASPAAPYSFRVKLREPNRYSPVHPPVKPRPRKVGAKVEDASEPQYERPSSPAADLPSSPAATVAGSARVVAVPRHSGGFSSTGHAAGGSSSNRAPRDDEVAPSYSLDAPVVNFSSLISAPQTLPSLHWTISAPATAHSYAFAPTPKVFSGNPAPPVHHKSVGGSTSTSPAASTNALNIATPIFPSPTPPVARAPPSHAAPHPPVAFSQFASEDPTGFLLPGSLPAVSLFGYEPLSLLPDPRLAPIASAPPYAPDWSGFRPAQPPAKRQKLTLPRTPATPQSKPPKVKAPKPPKAPKAPKIVVRPEFTISKTDWVTPSALPMLAVEPPIVLRADPVGERPPKNPHRERVGIEIVEEKRKGDLDLILRTVAGPVRAPPKSKKGKEKALEPTEGVESKQDTFTLVHALPPIWCMGRQELCEALPYYHSYQGGHYDKDERCIGYLLDGFPSPKDCCADGGWVIISHGGGCSDVSKEEGYHLTSNQERDNLRVRALINCHKTHCPVVLIAGSSYDFFPWLATRKIRYAVLGYYFVDKFWAEAEPLASDPTKFLVRFKFRFAWVPSQGEPWFSQVIGGTPSSSAPILPHSPVSRVGQLLIEGPPSPSTSLAPTFVEEAEPSALHESICRTCSAVSTSVYEEDIACYDERCSSFFQVNGVVAHAKNLTIRAPFLRAVNNPDWPSTVPLPLIPKSMADVLQASVNFSQEGWRAFICGKCGRLSSRSQWHQLECECCGNIVPVDYKNYTADEASKPLPGGLVAPGKMAPGITKTPITLPGLTGWSYHLSPTAIVHHLRPTNAPDVAESDRFFEEYQQDAAAKLFRRNALGMHKVPGEYLCSQFSFNTGQAYKHVVKVPTYSFEESPKVVGDACYYLTKVTRRVVTLPSAITAGPFNEVLSVGYMQGSKMNFHDDGEKGLGPLVTTLSLGGEAAMAFRKKDKKSKVKTEDVPLEPADTTAPAAKKAPRTLLTLKLVHADITIMEGEDVQKYFEHAITAKEGLRFAPTCREIGPDHYL